MAKIKGTGIVGVVRLLRERRDHVEPVLEADLRPYLDRQVLVASWYPEADFLGLLRAMAYFTPKSGGDSWHWLGGHCAEVDLVEVYGSMVQKGNVWGTLERFPRLWRLYHDSGQADVGMLRTHEARVLVRDFAFADEDFCRFMTGYLRRMLKLAGAKGIEVKAMRLGGVGKSATWQVRWGA
ncbi:MAG: DUF2378 family protein [Acidobacteriota bacterium]